MQRTHETFGEYLLLRTLRQDPLGTVWRAGEINDRRVSRLCTLRVFDGPAADASRIARSIAHRAPVETRCVAPGPGRLRHIGREEKLPYVSYPYTSSFTFGELFAQSSQVGRRIGTDVALLLIERLALAVDAAWQSSEGPERLAHGFLNRHAACVSHQGEVYVTGFAAAPGARIGLLRSLTCSRPGERSVGSQEEVGDLKLYLSPDALTGEEIHPSDDVFSLSVLLFELLSGRPVRTMPPKNSWPTAIGDLKLGTETSETAESVRTLLRASLTDPRVFTSVSTWRHELSRILNDSGHQPTAFNIAALLHSLFAAQLAEEDRSLTRDARMVGTFVVSADGETAPASAATTDTAMEIPTGISAAPESEIEPPADTRFTPAIPEPEPAHQRPDPEPDPAATVRIDLSELDSLTEPAAPDDRGVESEPPGIVETGAAETGPVETVADAPTPPPSPRVSTSNTGTQFVDLGQLAAELREAEAAETRQAEIPEPTPPTAPTPSVTERHQSPASDGDASFSTPLSFPLVEPIPPIPGLEDEQQAREQLEQQEPKQKPKRTHKPTPGPTSGPAPKPTGSIAPPTSAAAAAPNGARYLLYLVATLVLLGLIASGLYLTLGREDAVLEPTPESTTPSAPIPATAEETQAPDTSPPIPAEAQTEPAASPFDSSHEAAPAPPRPIDLDLIGDPIHPASSGGATADVERLIEQRTRELEERLRTEYEGKINRLRKEIADTEDIDPAAATTTEPVDELLPRETSQDSPPSTDASESDRLDYPTSVSQDHTPQ